MEQAHHDLGVNEVFGAAEGDEANLGSCLGLGFGYTCGLGLGGGSHSLLVYQVCDSLLAAFCYWVGSGVSSTTL
jgi:hypothetical protein